MNNAAFKLKRKDTYAAVTKHIEDGINPVYETWANQLLKGREPNQVLAALLYQCFNNELNTELDTELSSDGKPKKKSYVAKSNPDDTRLFVGIGKSDGLNARDLVSMVLEKIPIKSRQITGIHILESFAFMTLPKDKADQLVACYENLDQPPLITYENKDKDPK
ncbi:MAG: DbpA RNA binding domain-containing protein [Planctomycetes bacterium]|nr:DbpA RNA binding domain-containing protein [Planctomycetota bacterium]